MRLSCGSLRSGLGSWAVFAQAQKRMPSHQHEAEPRGKHARSIGAEQIFTSGWSTTSAMFCSFDYFLSSVELIFFLINLFVIE